MKTWFNKFGAQWPAHRPHDLNPTEHHWYELEHLLCTRLPRLTSVLDLTNACVAEWAQSSTAMLQNLVESLASSVEVIVTAKRGTKSGLECLKSMYGSDGQMSTNFWPCSIHLPLT